MLIKDMTKEQRNKYERDRQAYWAMIDYIIDGPVGNGDSALEAVGDGNHYGSRQRTKREDY
jgi:hypothetical protein